MDSNKKSFIPGVLIMTIIFALLSAYLIYNLYQGEDLTPYTKGSYVNLIETNMDIKLEGKTQREAVDELKALGYDSVIVPRKYDSYYKPCFDYVLDEEGIRIVGRTSKEFDEYPFEIGTIITKINETELKNVDYVEVFSYLFSATLGTKEFTLNTGEKITYTYQANEVKSEVSVLDKTVTIKLYNLDVTRRRYVYDATKNYENIVLDLSQATVHETDSIISYMGLFVPNKTVLFTKPEEVKTNAGYQLGENVHIILGDTKDAGILYLANLIHQKNSNVTFDISLKPSDFLTYHLFQNADYKVYVYNKQMTLGD